jgi:hypothetical protein
MEIFLSPTLEDNFRRVAGDLKILRIPSEPHADFALLARSRRSLSMGHLRTTISVFIGEPVAIGEIVKGS